MENNFSRYLFYMVLIIVFLLVLVIIIISRLKKRKPKPVEPKRIMCGNVSMFFDRSDNVTTIPYVKDKFGMGRATGSPAFLNLPYTAKELGQTLRQSMKLCENGTPVTDTDLMAKLNFKGWKEFSEGKRNISVHYQQAYGIVFNTTVRRSDGAYQFISSGFDKVLKDDASDEELGQMLVSLLPRCR